MFYLLFGKAIQLKCRAEGKVVAGEVCGVSRGVILKFPGRIGRDHLGQAVEFVVSEIPLPLSIRQLSNIADGIANQSTLGEYFITRAVIS